MTDYKLDGIKIDQGLTEGVDYILVDNGAVIYFRTLPPLAPKAVQVAYTKKNPEPLPPTYSQEAAGGVIVEHAHDKTTIATPEEIAAYEEYERSHAEWQAGLAERLMCLFWGEGTDLVLSDKTRDRWNKKLELYGIIDSLDELPTDETERKVVYLNVIGMKSKELIAQASGLVMRHTGVDSADLEAAEALF